MRVAYYSPLPPERSGIADYSYELLEELRHHVDLVAVVADTRRREARAPDGVALVGAADADADALTVDVNCYQMGNNARYHRFLWGRALDEPGLMLLHDPSLADFSAEMCGGAESSIFRAEVAYDCPEITPADDLPLVEVGNGRRDLDRLAVLMARRTVESCIRVLVHSSAIEHELRRRYPGVDLQTIQLPAPVLAEVRGRDDGAIVFGVFGGINYYKRVRPLVDAFLEVRLAHPRARMVIAGRADDHVLERELRGIAARPEVGGSLEIHTDLELAALEREMLGCDVGISLRWPTAGEMSATLMRTFGAGRPAIVSDVLQFKELDERYCWRVTTDFALEHRRLVELMDHAARDRERCRRAGDAARRFVEREATYAVVAGHYVEHLAWCADRRDAWRRARRVFSLAANAPVGVNLVVPSLAGEVAEAAHRVVGVLRRAGVDVVVLPLAPAEPRPPGTPVPGGDVVEADPAPDPAEQPFSTTAEDEELARARRALDPADAAIEGHGPYRVDLLFVDGREAARIGALARVRRRRGRRIVAVLAPGIVPLALEHRLLLELVDRIVVPSAHAAAVVGISTTVPVEVIPWPLAPAAPDPARPRPVAGPCRFVTVVPSDTTIARANPLAAVAAYRAAFSSRERGRDAQLTVVLEAVAGREEAVLRLSEEVALVRGQLVLDPAPDALAALVAGSDVQVSLHRGVGFGLPLADALAVGRVVVATGYSGNLDFMDGRDSALVGYEVRDVEPDDFYLDALDDDLAVVPGRFWVDPDVAAAAAWMRRIALDPSVRARFAVAGRDRVRSVLDPGRIGARWREVLVMAAAPPGAASARPASPAVA